MCYKLFFQMPLISSWAAQSRQEVTRAGTHLLLQLCLPPILLLRPGVGILLLPELLDRRPPVVALDHRHRPLLLVRWRRGAILSVRVTQFQTSPLPDGIS